MRRGAATKAVPQPLELSRTDAPGNLQRRPAAYARRRGRNLIRRSDARCSEWSPGLPVARATGETIVEEGVPDLLGSLAHGPLVCAEGYLFECERRGYLQAGAFVPEVVLDHPEVVEELHREFVHAGSDVVEAFTYYGHREKLRVIGKEDVLEPLNRQALSIAARVARETGTLLAGNLCNTNVYEPGASAERAVRSAFAEQVSWAAEAGVDFVIAETFSWVGEALLALETIRSAGLPAVVTFAVHREGTLRDEISPAEACRRAEQAGADVVGLNCIRGPQTMLPLLAPIREAVSCPVAALPVPYRTTTAEPSMQALRDPARGGAQAFPTALDPFTCTRHELGDFATAALNLGVRYLGICCGAGPQHVRAVAEAAGKTPPASRYSPDMSKHSFLGSAPGITQSYREYAANL
jgi:betaine-homocysteine S-methyltransferase